MPPRRFPSSKPKSVVAAAKAKTSSSSGGSGSVGNKVSETDEKFEKELAWCIEQLELGLKRPNLDPEQIKESKKTISTFKSSSVSKVQKRHLMKTVFGDYRQWMQKLEKQKKQEEEQKLKQKEKKQTTDQQKPNSNSSTTNDAEHHPIHLNNSDQDAKIQNQATQDNAN